AHDCGARTASPIERALRRAAHYNSTGNHPSTDGTAGGNAIFHSAFRAANILAGAIGSIAGAPRFDRVANSSGALEQSRAATPRSVTARGGGASAKPASRGCLAGRLFFARVPGGAVEDGLASERRSELGRCRCGGIRFSNG